ncbi:hypothetical protein O181_019686 [Austropuccinia psidii MF-1]|uniref:Uncharacterized protein n=1 Tax=Austropuccinia psidii MF-1 TaxID=1389203 RepID=A0A9Q3C7N0_9BASI|nr:hypothetical protein [Austropuccinia psidii MF-1]
MTRPPECSPSAPPTFVFYGSGNYSQLGSLWPMPSSGFFSIPGPSSATTAMINNQGIAKSIIRIPDSPTNPYGEVSDEPHGEEFEVVDQSIGQLQNSSPSHSPSRTSQSEIIPSTATSFQSILASASSSVHQSSPHSSATRPSALASPMRPTPVLQPRPSLMQLVVRTLNRSRVDRLPLP